MSIGAVGSGSVQALKELQSIIKASSSASAGGTSAASAADGSSVSSAADMISKLKDLQQKDPAKFKQAMATIASKLTDAASAATDPAEKKALTDLSQKFQTAGTTGDLSGLAGPKHKGRGHRGSDAPPAAAPAGAAGASGASGVTVPAGAADTNGDGKISAAEQQAYDAQQATAGAKAYQSAAGNTHARREAMMSTVSTIVSNVLGGISG